MECLYVKHTFDNVLLINTDFSFSVYVSIGPVAKRVCNLGFQKMDYNILDRNDNEIHKIR